MIIKYKYEVYNLVKNAFEINEPSTEFQTAYLIDLKVKMETLINKVSGINAIVGIKKAMDPNWKLSGDKEIITKIREVETLERDYNKIWHTANSELFSRTKQTAITSNTNQSLLGKSVDVILNTNPAVNAILAAMSGSGVQNPGLTGATEISREPDTFRESFVLDQVGGASKPAIAVNNDSTISVGETTVKAKTSVGMPLLAGTTSVENSDTEHPYMDSEVQKILDAMSGNNGSLTTDQQVAKIKPLVDAGQVSSDPIGSIYRRDYTPYAILGVILFFVLIN